MSPAAAYRMPSPATAPIAQLALERMAASLTDSDGMPIGQFLQLSWPILEPSARFIPNWHIDLVAEHLEAIELGQIKDLAINMPPRNTKSALVTIAWPVCSWIRQPWLRYIFASHDARLSMKHSMDRRQIIQSPWYQRRWGASVRLAEDQNQQKEFRNTARGHMYSTSVGGAVTGQGCDRLVIDDLINPEKAHSKPEREKAIRYYQQSLTTRLNDKQLGIIVVIEHRTHTDDVTGAALKEGNFTHLSIPAEAPIREVVIFPLSKREVVREPGSLICEARENAAALAKQKKRMGTSAYQSQYNQAPASDLGNMIKRHWWKYYHELPKDQFGQPRPMSIVIQSWDMAFKDKETGSRVAWQVWALIGVDRYLLDFGAEHLDMPGTLAAVERLSLKWPQAMAKLVEDRANGPAVMQLLKDKIAGLIPVEPTGSKEARAAAASPVVESGNTYLPHKDIRPDIEDFVEELAAFPNGSQDDQVDAFSQAMVKLSAVEFVDDSMQDAGNFLTDARGIMTDDPFDLGEGFLR